MKKIRSLSPLSLALLVLSNSPADRGTTPGHWETDRMWAGSACSEFSIEPVAGGRDFGALGSVEVAPDGYLHAAETFERQVVVISPEGELSAIEPVGEEVGEPLRIGWLNGERYVVARDRTTVAFLRPGGETRSIVSLQHPPFEPPMTTGWVMGLVDRERAAYHTGADVHAMASGLVPDLAVVATTYAGEVVDTIYAISTRNMFLEAELSSGTRFLRRQPFHDGPLFALSPWGLWFVAVENTVGSRPGDTYFTIRWWTPRADTIVSRRFPVPAALPVLADVVDETVVDILGAHRNVEGAFDAVRDVLFVPSVHPPITRVLVDPTGAVWVAYHSPSDDEHIRWEAIGDAGAVRACLEVPQRLSLRAVSGSVAWASESLGGRRFRLFRLQMEAEN